MTNLVLVTYINVFSMTEAEYKVYHGLHPYSDQKIDGHWHEAHKSYRDAFVTQINRFENSFIKKVNSEDYYFFIIAQQQLAGFKTDFDKFNLKRFVHWESPYLAANKNIGGPPRLKVYIFKFPPKFVEEMKK